MPKFGLHEIPRLVRELPRLARPPPASRRAALLLALLAAAVLLAAFAVGAASGAGGGAAQLRGAAVALAPRLLLAAAAILAALAAGAGRGVAARRRALAWAYLAAVAAPLLLGQEAPECAGAGIVSGGGDAVSGGDDAAAGGSDGAGAGAPPHRRHSPLAPCRGGDGARVGCAATARLGDGLVRAAFLAARAGLPAGGAPDPALAWLAGTFLGRSATEALWLGGRPASLGAGLPDVAPPFSGRAFLLSPDFFQVAMLGELVGHAPAFYAAAIPLKLAQEAWRHWRDDGLPAAARAAGRARP